MKYKKGFLLGEQTVKVIIAVLCLLLLFYLLFKMYSSYRDAKNLEMAKATLKELDGKMNLAKSGKEQSMTLLEPHKWIFVSFIKSDKPLKCLSKSCICICTYDEPGFHVVSRDKNLCNALGNCINFDDKVNEFDYVVRDSSIAGKLSRAFGILATSVDELKIKYDTKNGFIISSAK